MDKDNNASFESTGSPIVPPESSNSQTNISPSESKPPKPPSKRKSESSGGRAPSSVWDHLDKVIGEDGKRRAVCKYCYKEYMADSRTHGTSNLRSHTPNCKQFPNNDKDGQQTLSFKPKQNAEEGVEVVATSFSFDACKRALAEMVIIDELPFRFVEGVGFKRFCNVAVPKFTPIPSRHTIAREVTNIFNNEKDKEKAGRVLVVALWCVQYLPEERPLMSVVVKMLEGGVELPRPRNPFRHLMVAGSPFPDRVAELTKSGGVCNSNAESSQTSTQYEIEIS